MKGIQTPTSNAVYALEGGTKANDLHVMKGTHAGADGLVAPGDPIYHLPYVASVWQPDEHERAALAVGANVELLIIGGNQPPVCLRTTSEQSVDQPPRPDLDDRGLSVRLNQRNAVDLVSVLDLLAIQAERTIESGVELDEGLEATLERLEVLRLRLREGLEELTRPEEEPDA